MSKRGKEPVEKIREESEIKEENAIGTITVMGMETRPKIRTQIMKVIEENLLTAIIHSDKAIIHSEKDKGKHLRPTNK